MESQRMWFAKPLAQISENATSGFLLGEYDFTFLAYGWCDDDDEQRHHDERVRAAEG